MHYMRPTILAAMAALLAAWPVPAQTVDDWRADLRVLATELPARHRNAFAHMTRPQWDSAVAALDARLPRLRRHEVIVELMRLVAMVRDGHTALTPEFDPAIGFHRLPIQLYDFSDGLYIIAADSAHRDIAGARVVSIGPASSAAAMEAVGHVVSHEGANWVRARAASLLAIPEVLTALGLGGDTLHGEFGVSVSGRQRSVTLTATANAAGDPHHAPALPVNMRHASPAPLWLGQPDATWWFTVTAESTLYIRYRAVQPFAEGEPNEVFFRRAFAAGDSARVGRVVLDIRENGGGNNFMNRFVVKEIIRRPALDRANRLFVLIGRGVFSAAQNLVNELDYYTNATFVGEPTGNAPNQYGDARPLELPRSRLRVMVSSLLWQGHRAGDDRAWFTPDVYVEMSSDDYRNGRDPVLAAALRRSTEPSLAERLETAAAAGDTSAVQSIIRGYRDHPEHRFRDVEADVNSAGYALLRGGRTDAAVLVFRANTELFPGSANVYDSYGEALERAGRKDDAIAAFRKALSLDPRMGSSRDGLRRLGVTP
jgi:hypothetical protein